LASDTTDAEWLVLEPMMPGDLPLGRRRKWEWRALVDAMLYLRAADFPGECCRLGSFRLPRQFSGGFIASGRPDYGERSITGW
jgi:hypothetical protein